MARSTHSQRMTVHSDRVFSRAARSGAPLRRAWIRAWDQAYEARDRELFDAKEKPIAGTMAGTKTTLAGTRRKAFQVKTVFWFKKRKPITIFTVSDGR